MFRDAKVIKAEEDAHVIGERTEQAQRPSPALSLFNLAEWRESGMGCVCIITRVACTYEHKRRRTGAPLSITVVLAAHVISVIYRSGRFKAIQ